MKHFLLGGVCLAAAMTAAAAPVKLFSPETAQTYAVSWVVGHQLTWNARTGQFGAAVQFSDRSATKWREEESFRFVFPEVKLDTTNRIFYVTNGNAERVPVAQWQKSWLGSSIVPTPGTSVLIANEGGKVRLVLTADSDLAGRRAGRPGWVEQSDAWVLQNLLRDVAGLN